MAIWGFTFIIHDDQGLIASVSRESMRSCTICCLAGLGAAAHLGLQKIVLESDASLVKTAFEGDDYILSVMSGVITELGILWMSYFVSTRVYNSVLHRVIR